MALSDFSKADQSRIHALVEKCGALEFWDEIAASVLPACAIEIEPGEVDVLGKSRLGGTPDFPAEWTWPIDVNGSYLTFLGQVNFAEVPMFDEPMPRSGILYLFLGELEPCNLCECQVKYWDGDVADLTRLPLPRGEFAEQRDRYDSGLLKFDLPEQRPFPSLPYIKGLADEIDEKVTSAFGSDWGNSTSALGGHTRGCQGYELPRIAYRYQNGYALDSEVDEEEVAAIGRWQTLLEVASHLELDMCWWDAGRLVFQIDRDALRQRDFSKVHLQVDT